MGLLNRMWIIFYVIFAISLILFFLTTAILSVKMMSYSQEPSRAQDFKNYEIFSEDCHNAMKTCSKITVQSRVEGAKVVDEQGRLIYVQTSHTEWFLGLIKDGVYFLTLGPAPEDNPNSVCLADGNVCLYVDCTKRIANSPITCDFIWEDFEKCMTKNENENFLKCSPNVTP
mmetsp:Transcript_5006/g.5703  ORF Transcript_5006/g.5703 Transcript_5006/m.5703 type:complete len:172 (+) Transcript_5006:12-527(+)